MPKRLIPQFEITPNLGVGPIKLGMTRSDVRGALAAYAQNALDQESHRILDYAFGNSLQIEYDKTKHAQFIGVGFYEGCGCDYLFQGQHIGKYSAEELFQLLAALDGNDKHVFDDSEYYFPNIMMTVWEADSQYDSLGGNSRPVYGQVAVTNERYRDATSDSDLARRDE